MDTPAQVGDASGIQSPLSFGGFGALTRHLGRLRGAVTGALAAEALGKQDLARVNPCAHASVDRGRAHAM